MKTIYRIPNTVFQITPEIHKKSSYAAAQEFPLSHFRIVPRITGFKTTATLQGN